jgi:translocation and assembly module TamB
LQQSDILAYLLFDAPLQQVSNADAQVLLQAANALDLGGSQIARLNQELQHLFALDSVTIASTTMPGSPPVTASEVGKTPVNNLLNQNTSVILTKALGKRLFINYSIGLLQQMNILRLRYLLSNYWALQMETSTAGSGMDVFYTVEAR